MKLNQNKIFAVVIPILLVGNVVALIQARKASDKLTASQQQLQNLTAEQQDLQTLTAKKSEVETDIDRLAAQLPQSETDVAAFLETISAMARERSLGLETSVEDDVASQPKVGTVQIGVSINVSGPYVGVTQYLSDVYNLPYYFSVSEVSVKPRIAGGVEARLRLGLYSQELTHE